MRILVTGASGKAGKWVVRDLVEVGHDVVATDIVPALPDCPAPFIRADLTDYGQAVAVLDGFEAVAHLANIPAPELFTPVHTLNTNNAMNSNVFLAAADRRLQRVVWASSETTLGLPFDEPPRYAPVDEEHFPVPTTTYALSKVVAETMAVQVSAWSGIPFAALRLSNVIDPSDYDQFPTYWPHAQLRRWNLWGYIDARDAASAFRHALQATTEGAVSAIVANDETVMDRPSVDLVREVFPGVELTHEISSHQTLLANDRAKNLFGWSPTHSWHDELGRP
ncbi:MAG TPA: NAD(P)-dependent oxidoreductase [Jatrophihabitantaceae bacterium]|nr:NAD(P)-dependent oxidoreductase [Jatrophihabitantaceae bacterium]